MEKVFTVKGMSCGHCKAAVERGLSVFREIEQVKVDLEKELVTVTLQEELKTEKMVKAIEDQGYEVEKVH